jgi:hypothetical protein
MQIKIDMDKQLKVQEIAFKGQNRLKFKKLPSKKLDLSRFCAKMVLCIEILSPHYNFLAKQRW